jgi:hypothetical protein
MNDPYMLTVLYSFILYIKYHFNDTTFDSNHDEYGNLVADSHTRGQLVRRSAIKAVKLASFSVVSSVLVQIMLILLDPYNGLYYFLAIYFIGWSFILVNASFILAVARGFVQARYLWTSKDIGTLSLSSVALKFLISVLMCVTTSILTHVEYARKFLDVILKNNLMLVYGVLATAQVILLGISIWTAWCRNREADTTEDEAATESHQIERSPLLGSG